MKEYRTLYTSPLFHRAFLIFLGATLFIPFLGNVHLFDWDEINFAEAAREMLITKNFMRVTIDFQPFWEKPPLFFWCIALSMKIFGINEFSARFVNAVVGIITLLVVYNIGRKKFDTTFGLLWALAFVGSFLPHVFFKSGIIDPLFNLFIFLGLNSAINIILTDNKKERIINSLLSGLFIGLGNLTKGPVAFLLFFLTIVIYQIINRRKILFSVKEIILFFATMIFVSGIFYGIETLFHGTWFIKEFIKYQIRLFRTGDAGHGRPFYFHFLVLLFGCYPASFFAIRAFKPFSVSNNNQREYIKIVTILFWVVLILFSIVKTKTVLYSSLAWYPITFLGALHVRKIIGGEAKWNNFLQGNFLLFTLIVGLIITLFPLLMIKKEIFLPLIKDNFTVAILQKPVKWSIYNCLIGIVFFLLSLTSFVLLKKGKVINGFITLFLSSVLAAQMVLIVFCPKIEQYTQGGPISFYKEHSGEDEYVKALYKSYADLFYGKKLPTDHPESHKLEWLLKGPIDKPVYFVGRLYEEKKYSSPEYNLVLLKKEYGFVYFMRIPETEENLFGYALNLKRGLFVNPHF
ncbi:MAG: glycosyltransferase family 39 protein [Chitinispirillaceae bacterium]|nr:glycosyltransferase family 39 protein [Chitinispirillaceae bacterium]